MSGKQPALSVRTRVRRRIRRRIDALPTPLSLRVRRLWLSAVPITQCAVAAGLAWWIAVVPLDHDRPFFAPIAAVVSLGLSLAKRWRRSVELVSGVTVGILAGDLVISWIGSGTWQIMVVIAIAMSIAVFLDDGPLLPMQAASSAALVATLLPPGDSAGIERAVDALIGG
ncbi:MAG: FUSC family protein, partial [Gordonia amarae]